MGTISFSIDEQTKKEIAQLASREGQSQSDLFRELWKQYKFSQTLDYLQKLNRRQALTLGIESDDDVERIFG